MAWCSELPEHFVHPSQALITHVVIIVSVATSPSLSPASEPSQGPQCPTQRLAQGRHLINEWEGLNSQEEGYGPSPLSCSLHPPLRPLPQAGLIDFVHPFPPAPPMGPYTLNAAADWQALLSGAFYSGHEWHGHLHVKAASLPMSLRMCIKSHLSLQRGSTMF